MTGSAAALVSFEESSTLLHALAGVEVSATQVERAAEAPGAEIEPGQRAALILPALGTLVPGIIPT